MPTRGGACNHCGQCCGAEGSPHQENPWPSTWPEAHRNWQTSALPIIYQVVSSPEHGGPRAGAIRFGSKTYRWIWIPDVGLCKDMPPFGDTASYSLECPFLMDEQPNGSRPCALTGTPYEGACNQENMPEDVSDEFVADWTAKHPVCSYTWN